MSGDLEAGNQEKTFVLLMPRAEKGGTDLTGSQLHHPSSAQLQGEWLECLASSRRYRWIGARGDEAVSVQS